ncbi:NAD(P)-dependent oxidoreductase [Pedobacter sp. PAMC26386]|nr:NAD(P)-dependent oxidoreductase [Pedobacter sp. PAMC26386]
MSILITGSSGHLGEALIKTLIAAGEQVVGVDLIPSNYTDFVGDISDGTFVAKVVDGVDAILHTATLHKPHVATHSRLDFINTNVAGTLNLLEEAVLKGVKTFVMTSTTSAFGDALSPGIGEPAVWIDEEVIPKPKNIYGVTKLAAENLCELFHRNNKLNCIILRTSRFFAEDDDQKDKRIAFENENLKVNEMLYRRADIADMVSAHICAIKQAESIGFGKYIISGNSPFRKEDLSALRENAPSVVAKYYPEFLKIYKEIGWKMLDSIDRVYCNEKAKHELLWTPKYDFPYLLTCLKDGREHRSELSLEIGSKGYHSHKFSEGPYSVGE